MTVRRLVRGIGGILRTGPSGDAGSVEGATEGDVPADPANVIDRTVATADRWASTCPSCGSGETERRASCPRCGSDAIAHQPVFEHFACGCTRPQADFEADDGYVCPECRASLRGVGVDFARVGLLYRCGDCEVVVDRPVWRTACPACAGTAERDGPHPDAVTVEFGGSGVPDQSGERRP